MASWSISARGIRVKSFRKRIASTSLRPRKYLYSSNGGVMSWSSQIAFPALLPIFSPLEVVRRGTVKPNLVAFLSNFSGSTFSSITLGTILFMTSIPDMIFPN